MKNKLIAYLIQAHNNENYLFKLINSLNNKEVSFFIHIDEKANINNFKNLFKNFDNIFFIKNRVNIVWKWFSQVKATINLIDFWLKQKIKFKYFILLSWVDFPIKPNKSILNFFKSTNENFLEFKEIKKSNNYLDYFKNKQLWFKISKWHFYDDFKKNFSWKSWGFKNLLYRIFILFNILIINSFIKKKKIDNNIKYYFWSSWWCLNYETIKHIYQFYKNNDEINNIFKYSDAPDEMYFQTIILNSKYKKNCVNNNLRYIDWSKNREWPAILDINDFENINKSDVLFARKFWKNSKLLIKKIEKVILK